MSYTLLPMFSRVLISKMTSILTPDLGSNPVTVNSDAHFCVEFLVLSYVFEDADAKIGSIK